MEGAILVKKNPAKYLQIQTDLVYIWSWEQKIPGEYTIKGGGNNVIYSSPRSTNIKNKEI